MKGGSGKCDLCSTKFNFAPKYAKNAPEKLNTLQVISGLGLRAASKWLPFALRLLLVAGIWLGVLPLATAYIYHGWMKGPTEIRGRMIPSLLAGDIVNGGILTLTIIISFLSLMSLGDFFRFNWPERVNENDTDEGKKEDQNDVKIAPVQVGDDADNLYYDDSSMSLSEKFRAEKHIIQKMICDSNKSVMDGGQLFHKYDSDDSRKEIMLDDIVPNDLLEMESYLATGEGDDQIHAGIAEMLEQRRHAAAALEENILGRHQEGGVAAVRRQRRRHAFNDEDNENNDSEQFHDSLNEVEDESPEGNDESEEELLRRMMELQEFGEEVPENDEQNERPEGERFEPRFDPLDGPFDNEELMVRAYNCNV